MYCRCHGEMKFRCVEFLGVRFYEGSVEDIYALHSEVRGLMVVPSGPGLALPMDRVKYFDALRGSDIAIFDSGYFCLLLLLFKGIRVKKLSGLRYLEAFLPRMAKSGETLFTVDPSSDQRDQTFHFLRNSGVNVVEQHHIAPFYDPENIDDEDLIKKILRVRPDRIMLNIGGGTQEPLVRTSWISAPGSITNHQFCVPEQPSPLCLVVRQTFLDMLTRSTWVGWLGYSISQEYLSHVISRL